MRDQEGKCADGEMLLELSALTGTPRRRPQTLQKAEGKLWRVAPRAVEKDGKEDEQVSAALRGAHCHRSGPRVLQYLEEEYRKGAREDDPMPRCSPTTMAPTTPTAALCSTSWSECLLSQRCF